MTKNETQCCHDLGPALIKAGKTVLKAAQSSQNMEQIYQVCGHHGWVIYYLEEQERKGNMVCQKDIEDQYPISRSNVSRLVKNLEKNGIIERSIDENDTRCKRLRLTPEGRRLLSQAADEHDRLEQTIARGFTREELSLLSDYLHRIMENFAEGDKKSWKQ
jgi:DNA-binding MarR family transcriptional regulator